MCDDDKGFVITLIMKSNSAPHQMIPNRNYFIRAGSDFVPCPHDVLSGMFGRRPQPKVFHHFLMAVPQLDGDKLVITFGLVIHNEGPGLVSDIFALCRQESLPSQNSSFHYEITEESKANWSGYWEGVFGQTSMVSNPELRVAPGANVQPVVYHLELAPPFNEALRITGSVGAGAFCTYTFTIEASAELITAQYNQFVEKDASDSFAENERHEIVSVIVKDTSIENQ
jgi:hypothetical protein